MPIIRINADGAQAVLHGAPHPIAPVLERALDHSGPVVVMVHGYRFRPYDPVDCPHLHILSSGGPHTCPKALSWPRHLGFGHGRRNEGVAIAFGWSATGTPWQARKSSGQAALALAGLVTTLRRIAPDRPVHILAHSLGAHLVLASMARLADGDLGRVILLNGACYHSHAAAALATPAGRSCEVFNIASRENALFDLAFETLYRGQTWTDRALGRGLWSENAVTVRLEDRATLGALAAQGFPIPDPTRRPCHWSTYLRPGVFAFYQALIRTPEALPLSHLQRLLRPAPPRRFPRPGREAHLHAGMKQAS